mgnify:CR=1 FL=1
MNNKLLSLIQTDLNITFGLSSIMYNIKNKKKIFPMAMIVLALISLLPSYILMVRALDSFYDAFRQIGQQSYFLHIGFMSAQMIVLMLGMMYVMSKYYFSNDLPQLVPLPIKPSQIIGSKFVSLMISEYLTSLPVILPFVIIYGRAGNEGFSYWTMSLIAVVALPMLPLVVSSVLIMVFMKYTNIHGLPSNRINSIIAHKNAVWVGTDNGLARIKEEKIQTISSTEAKSPSNIKSLCASGDILWLGTESGIQFINTAMVD